MIFDNLVVNLFRFRPARDRDRHHLFLSKDALLRLILSKVAGGNETILKVQNEPSISVALRQWYPVRQYICFGRISQSIEGFDSGSE